MDSLGSEYMFGEDAVTGAAYSEYLSEAERVETRRKEYWCVLPLLLTAYLYMALCCITNTVYICGNI